MSLRESIAAALKDATRAQDRRRMSTLRLINAAIKDRDIAARTSGVDSGVDEPTILEILAKMVKQREESARTYEEAGRVELAEQERQEIEVINEFLPKKLSDEEVRAVCSEVVEEIDGKGMKDMGRCMSALKQRYPGRMDFSAASGIVKELLK